jgi:uncharacterized protein (DUF2252 family)
MTEEPHSPKERKEYGRSLRESAPLESHGDWTLPADRADPVRLVEEQNETRMPWLVPVRRARMSASAFSFFRGAARIMAWDLAPTPVSGLTAQICGDAHIANFGAYASPERRLVFDLNDFDETLPGPWEWDVKRLAASMFIAARFNGLKKKEARSLTESTVRSYRKSMADFARMGLLDLWYCLAEVEESARAIKDKKVRGALRSVTEKAKRKDSRHALLRLAEEVEGRYRIRHEPPLLVRGAKLREESARDEVERMILGGYEQYLKSVPDEIEHLLRRFRPVDFAVKVIGVGSVGTRCGILLLEGRDQADPLFLQIKEANESVLEEHLGRSRYGRAGRRVVEGQRLMQTVSDIFLGYFRAEASENDYFMRQLKDWKGSANVESASADALATMGPARGWTLARAHERSGDPIAIAGYLGNRKTFDRAVTAFAERYAEQNEADFEAFVAGIESGRLEAHEYD